jgi:glycosyltransferase involved in cell wall biosynthesis
MLASILINNYNYGRFLREAIDSALNQSYPHIEVIVVDDGSTDDSRDIIASYGDRISPVLKENGGQASAINAGFAASHGDVVCFLDADDVFLPEKVSCVLQAWKEAPRACLVYHQLQAINAQREKVGRPWPHAVWRGSIRHRVEHSGGWWPYPSTSGLCFVRSYLERLFPVPMGPHLVWADTYLAGPAPFFGPVIGLRVPLTLYRIHGQNHWAFGGIDYQNGRRNKSEIIQRMMNQYVIEFDMLRESLNKKLTITSHILLGDHLPYQKYRRDLGDSVSLLKIIFMSMKCPSLPLSMKLRVTVKTILNK